MSYKPLCYLYERYKENPYPMLSNMPDTSYRGTWQKQTQANVSTDRRYFNKTHDLSSLVRTNFSHRTSTAQHTAPLYSLAVLHNSPEASHQRSPRGTLP